MAISPAAIREVYDGAERLVLQKITTRIAKDGGISGDHWLKRKEAEINRHRTEIDKILQKFAIDGPKAVEDLVVQGYMSGVLSADGDLIDAGAKMVAKPISFKPSKLGEAVSVTGTFGAIHASAINSLVAEATGGLKGAHVVMLRQARDAYRDIIMQVAPSAVAGVDTRLQATQRALRTFGDKGIGTFGDKAGKNWDIASYAEMATRTSMAHAHVQGHINRLSEQGNDLVIVSNHPEASDLCRPHEGKVYSISGDHPTYPKLSWAISTGLFHPNCRHTINAYIEGLTETPDVHGDPKGYEQRMKQRYLERQVRHWKKREITAITPKDKAMAKAKVKEWQNKVQSHVRQTGGVRDYSREKVYPGTFGKGPAPTSGKIPSMDPAATVGKLVKEAKSEIKDAMGGGAPKTWADISKNLTFLHDGNAVKSVFKDVSRKDWDEATELFKKHKPDMTDKVMPLSELGSAQPANATYMLEKMAGELNTVDKLLGAGDGRAPFTVYRYKGQDILVDGNHRATLLRQHGVKDINVKFVDLDELSMGAKGEVKDAISAGASRETRISEAMTKHLTPAQLKTTKAPDVQRWLSKLDDGDFERATMHLDTIYKKHSSRDFNTGTVKIPDGPVVAAKPPAGIEIKATPKVTTVGSTGAPLSKSIGTIEHGGRKYTEEQVTDAIYSAADANPYDDVKFIEIRERMLRGIKPIDREMSMLKEYLPKGAPKIESVKPKSPAATPWHKAMSDFRERVVDTDLVVGDTKKRLLAEIDEAVDRSRPIPGWSSMLKTYMHRVYPKDTKVKKILMVDDIAKSKSVPKSVKTAMEKLAVDAKDGTALRDAIVKTGDVRLMDKLSEVYGDVRKIGLGHSTAMDAARDILAGTKKLDDFVPKITTGEKLVKLLNDDKTMWESQHFRMGPADDAIERRYADAKRAVEDIIRKHPPSKDKYYNQFLNADGSVDFDKYFDATKEHMKKLIDESLPTVRVSPSVLQTIVKTDGRFKSQFETGKSNGMFNPSRRKAVESNLFNTPNDMKNEDRPIYGLLDGPHGQTSGGKWYGAVKVRMRKSAIMDRSTVTIGDSLDYDAAGMRMSNPETRITREDILVATDPSKIHHRSYTEFQVHGGLSLSDVERVDISQFDIGGPDMIKALEQIESHGIPVRVWSELDNDRKSKDIWSKSLAEFKAFKG
jgi:hypothetical protein